MPAKYLVFDATPIEKPRDLNAPFSDTFSWPRLIHLSWIILDENYKPVQDYDCVVKPEGFGITNHITKYAKLEEEEISKKGEALDDILDHFTKSIDEVELLISHNMKVGENILAAEYLRRGLTHNLFKADRMCLMQESTYYCKIPSKRGGYKWPSLREMHAVLFNQAYTPSGNARADVIAASRCFIKLMKLGQLADFFED